MAVPGPRPVHDFPAAGKGAGGVRRHPGTSPRAGHPPGEPWREHHQRDSKHDPAPAPFNIHSSTTDEQTRTGEENTQPAGQEGLPNNTD